MRVVHFSESLALIYELFEYVYTCVTCRIYFHVFIYSLRLMECMIDGEVQ